MNNSEGKQSPARPAAWLWSVNPLSIILLPISALFCALVRLRRLAYQRRWLKSQQLARPVIIVGNLSVGGHGKTPVTIALVNWLRDLGVKPGVLTRGYKSDNEARITLLAGHKKLIEAGDEANLISQLTGVPIAVSADRFAAGQALIEGFPEVDCLICDDGLQHYALSRDIEIVVERKSAYGNGWCLPAGPMREPLSRQQLADVVISRDGNELNESLGICWKLDQPEQTRAVEYFASQDVFALAGIGFPELFFHMLENTGIQAECHAFPDHYDFQLGDLHPFKGKPVLITHKDAVKIEQLLRNYKSDARLWDFWVVPLELTLSVDLQSRLWSKINPLLTTTRKTDGQASA